MKPYELARILAEPVLPFFYAKIRRDLKGLARPGAKLLDVGGRRSPYTVGIPAQITIFDRPRETEVQKSLELGIDSDLLATVKRRRSNVESIVLGDMTRCQLPSASYDGVISIEVIEHVEEDDRFVAEIARVLRPGGWAYLTTPNGDYITKPHPDHLRHYKRGELTELLARHFQNVSVTYGVATSRHRLAGLRSFDPRRPLRLLSTMYGNLRNHRESRGVDERAHKTANLFAVVRKA